jgi:hypothetical protein
MRNVLPALFSVVAVAFACGGPSPGKDRAAPAPVASGDRAQADPSNAELAAARNTVDAFYRFHFSHNNGFGSNTAVERKRWLAANLRAGIDAYFAKPRPSDEVPPIDSDPFTDSQDHPASFHITAVVPKGREVEATVEFSFGVPVGAEKRIVWVQLTRCEQGFCISDLRYEDGSTLRAHLRQ